MKCPFLGYSLVTSPSLPLTICGGQAKCLLAPLTLVGIKTQPTTVINHREQKTLQKVNSKGVCLKERIKNPQTGTLVEVDYWDIIKEDHLETKLAFMLCSFKTK